MLGEGLICSSFPQISLGNGEWGETAVEEEKGVLRACLSLDHQCHWNAHTLLTQEL